MIKTVVNREEESQEWNYPCLGISKTSGLIVLFSEQKIGMVVRNNEIYKVGYSDEWFMDSFEPFQGSITIENI